MMMTIMLLTILISLAMHLLQGGGQMPWRTIGANPDDDKTTMIMTMTAMMLSNNDDAKQQ